jgi:DNA-binding response OmpR family regulator
MDKINILIGEDEAIVALDIKRTILKMGFAVTNMVTNYDDALTSVKEKTPDIVLLDIHLKNSKDGIETAKAIKQIADIPIVYLTAFSDDKTIKRAVQTNPVGYLVKPFKRDDLKSILQLAIYKMNSNKCVETNLSSIGKGYVYDLANHNLFFKEHPIKLSPKESLLLEMLIEAKGNIVPFATLEQHIWQKNTVSDSALRTLLYRLRGKLEYPLIETIPSFGFKLAPPSMPLS